MQVCFSICEGFVLIFASLESLFYEREGVVIEIEKIIVTESTHKFDSYSIKK